MSRPREPLRVDPAELQMAADQLDAHASGFRTAYETARSRAGDVMLGSGLASAALPQLLAAWEADSKHFEKHFSRHAEAYREAARRYAQTDAGSAAEIDDAGSAL